MLMLEPASILTLESFRRLPPIVHKGNPGLDALTFHTGKPIYADEKDRKWLFKKGVKAELDVPPSEEQKGAVKITSDPAWAEVEIDGAYAGVSPQSQTLAPGKYNAKLRKQGFKDWERKISIAAGQTLEVHAEMERK